MFTGLIESVGEVERVETAPAGRRIRIRTTLAPELSDGDSVSVNGVCLTVVARDAAGISADVSPETLRVSTLERLTGGTPVNLERSLRADARLGGHFVQGHVDGTGTVEQLRKDGDAHWLTVAFPSSLAPYIVRKGSIAVDGISLTVADLAGRRFDVQIVPFTFEHTNLRAVRVHDLVNLECDILGKYVVRALELSAAER
jgi:riboflavin synthase